MFLHGSAVLTPNRRRSLCELVVKQGVSIIEAARRYGCSRKTAGKWVSRYRAGESLEDHSSRPRSHPNQTPAHIEDAIVKARRDEGCGPHPIHYALRQAGHKAPAVSTIQAIFRRRGCIKEPEKPVYQRYEHARPGDLIHADIKKLRGFLAPGHARTGDRSKRSHKQPWVYLHNFVDDASRLAYSSIQPDETAESALRAFEEARAFYEAHGITIRRVLTDNGSCYKKKWRARLDQLGITAKHTRPYTPRTNGKVERFNRTMLAEWAYADTYENSRSRNAMLPAFLQRYNHHRPHRGLNGLTPIQALAVKLAPAA